MKSRFLKFLCCIAVTVKACWLGVITHLSPSKTNIGTTLSPISKNPLFIVRQAANSLAWGYNDTEKGSFLVHCSLNGIPLLFNGIPFLHSVQSLRWKVINVAKPTKSKQSGVWFHHKDHTMRPALVRGAIFKDFDVV